MALLKQGKGGTCPEAWPLRGHKINLKKKRKQKRKQEIKKNIFPELKGRVKSLNFREKGAIFFLFSPLPCPGLGKGRGNPVEQPSYPSAFTLKYEKGSRVFSCFCRRLILEDRYFFSFFLITSVHFLAIFVWQLA